MGCAYFVNYTVRINTGAVEALRAAIEAAGLGHAFSVDDTAPCGTILSCEFAGECGYTTATDIEEFTKGPVSDAAAESILVTEECDSETKSYGIGPDGAMLLSAKRLGEIVELAKDLTPADLGKAVSDLGRHAVS